VWTDLDANADPGDYPPADYKIEPYKFTAREIRKLISLIRKNSCETDIDKHLRSNLSLLAFASKFFHSGHHGTWVIPQATIKPSGFSNGPGKIPDYLFAGDSSDGVTWWVVELKSPRHRLFTENKDASVRQSAALIDGTNQLRSYIEFCERNQGYIRDVLGLRSFTSPYGILIIGRESELHANREKQRLKSLFNKDSRVIQIRTYDAFIRHMEDIMGITSRLPFLSSLYLNLFVSHESTPRDSGGVV
jgi:hypothetical protein